MDLLADFNNILVAVLRILVCYTFEYLSDVGHIVSGLCSWNFRYIENKMAVSLHTKSNVIDHFF